MGNGREVRLDGRCPLGVASVIAPPPILDADDVDVVGVVLVGTKDGWTELKRGNEVKG